MFGYSSGAVLALEAAADAKVGPAITKLALYEPVCVLGTSRPRPAADLAERLTELIAAGRRGDAVELVYKEIADASASAIAESRAAPFWRDLEQMAHTIIHDVILIGDLTSPLRLAASAAAPMLAMHGAESQDWMRDGVRAIADTAPDARYLPLAGQTHDVDRDVLVPVLREFFAGGSPSAARS